MPKNLSRYLPIFCLSAAMFLIACGQKGSLYLPKPEVATTPQAAATIANTKAADSPPTALPQKGRITTNLMSVNTLYVRGALAQLNPTQKMGWQALLTHSPNKKNLLRYVVFDGDILGGNPPLTVLTGHVQNKAIKSSSVSRTINSGYYLRVRSLETGISRIPSLMATAREYLITNPMLRRTPQNERSDFLIDSQNNIDLYLSVEKK